VRRVKPRHSRARLLLLALGLLVGCGADKGDAPLDPCTGGCVDAVADSSTDGTGLPDEGSETTFDIGVGDGADGEVCVPTEIPEKTCNRIDDDCDGIVDNVDIGKDGICDCLGILILGSPGSLASTSFEAWLKARGTTTTRRLDTAGGPLASADLAGIDVVILDRLSRTYAKSEIDALNTWVRAGGGLVSMTGYDWSGADATRPNDILTLLGATYDPAVKLDSPVTDWNLAHPIAKDMTSVTFAGGYAVKPLTGFKTTVVARLTGSPVGVAVEVDLGRVFVWGDEWIEYDSEWSTLPTVPKLWANILTWLGSRRCGGTGIK
jgi:hypothetical protein